MRHDDDFERESRGQYNDYYKDDRLVNDVLFDPFSLTLKNIQLEFLHLLNLNLAVIFFHSLSERVG